MIKRILMMTFLMFAHQILAADCSDIKNGEIIRIDQPGGSLENFHVQDQDGLGTCYANSASLLLQAALKNNPEVSYLQLASISKSANLENKRKLYEKGENFSLYAKKEQDSNKAINGGDEALEWQLAIDGGQLCDVVYRTQEQQKESKGAVLCPRKEINLEALAKNGDPRQSQFKSLLETSKYMNLFQGNFSDLNKEETWSNQKKIKEAKLKYENFKKSFSTLVSEKKKMLAESGCKSINVDSIGAIFQPAIQRALTNNNCNPNDKKSPYFCKVNHTLLSGLAKKGNYSYENQGMKAQFATNLMKRLNAPGKKHSAEQIKKDFAETIFESSKLTKTERTYAENYVQGLMHNVPTEKLSEVAEEFNEIQSGGMSQRCIERSLVSYLVSKNFEDDWRNDGVLCENKDLMLQASHVIIEYDKSGLKGIDQAMSFLLDKARLSYDEALMSLYALDCKAEEKIEIPQNLSCRDTAVNPASKESVDKQMIASLKANQPMGIYLCASILNKPKSSFEKDECGNHAVAITGIKCEEGKLKYLLQNSWGKNNKAANPAIITEEGKGAYWFDEQSFYDSVYRAVTLEKGK